MIVVVRNREGMIAPGALAGVRSRPSERKLHRVGDCRGIEGGLADLIADFSRPDVVFDQRMDCKTREERDRHVDLAPDSAGLDRSAVVISLISQNPVADGLVRRHCENRRGARQSEFEPVRSLPAKRLREEDLRFGAELGKVVLVLSMEGRLTGNHDGDRQPELAPEGSGAGLRGRGDNHSVIPKFSRLSITYTFSSEWTEKNPGNSSKSAVRWYRRYSNPALIFL